MTDHTFDTPTPINLDIRSYAGDVSVNAVDTTTTRVSLTGHHADEVRVAQMGDVIEIRTPHSDRLDVFPLRHSLRRAARIDMAIDVPLGSNLKLVLGAGDTLVTGVMGGVDVRPGAGRVRLDEAKGDLNIRLGAGSIDVNSICATGNLVSGAGSVSVGRASGNTSIELGTGEIRIDAVGGSARAKTGAGSIKVGTVTGQLSAESGVGGATVDCIRAGSFSFKGSGGGVKIGVASGVPVWTDLASVMGVVRNSLPPVGEPAPGQDHIELRVNIVSGGIELYPVS